MMIWRSCLGVSALAAHPIGGGGGGGGRLPCGAGEERRGGGCANRIIRRANKREVLAGIRPPPPPFSPLFCDLHVPMILLSLGRSVGRSVGVATVVMGPKAARASGASDLGSFLATCNVCDSARAVLLMRERGRDTICVLAAAAPPALLS